MAAHRITRWACFIYILVQILVQSHFDTVISSLALEATEPVSEPVTEMELELKKKSSHFSRAKR